MAPAVFHFGPFELIASRFELRRDGAIVKLERIPMDLLIVLAERNGDVVSRPEIVDRLWGKDVFVDTEHGINTAIRKIRAALQDKVEQPGVERARFGIDRSTPPATGVGNKDVNAAPPLDDLRDHCVHRVSIGDVQFNSECCAACRFDLRHRTLAAHITALGLEFLVGL